MSEFSKRLGRKFTITTEIKPPRGPDAEKLREELDMIRDLEQVTAVNVIDSPSARLLMSSLGASIMLKHYDIEPIFQMVCRDRNLLAMESDLLSAAAFGIENVLALTGDHPSRGASDHPNARPVYDLDSTSLLATITAMNQGMDPTGVELNAKTNFFSGAALNPNMRPIEPEVLKLKRKMDAGAKFFQTQAVFEASVMEKFLLNAEKLVGDIRPKIVVGIIPLASERMIQFLNRLPGIRVPTDVSHRVIHSKDPAAEGIAVAVETIDKIKGFGLGGAHIMPVGRMAALNQIVKKTAVP